MTIDDYLGTLLAQLKLPAKRRRRIAAEVSDHLTSATAELYAEGLSLEQAEREAIRRFGPARELAQTFLDQEAARSGWRATKAVMLLTALSAIVLAGPTSLPFRQAVGTGALSFLLGQVAVVAAVLTVVRGWRSIPEGGPRGAHLVLVLRGALVVTACIAAVLIDDAVHDLTHWSATAWLGLTAVAASLLLTAGALASGWIRARAAGARSAEGTDLLADLQTATVVALTRLERVAPVLGPALRPVRRTVVELPSALARRFPLLTGIVNLRRHPWLVALALGGVAGFMLGFGHALSEGGISAHHVPPQARAALFLATLEAVATLLGFLVLGGFLGLRPRLWRSDSSERGTWV